MTTIVLSVFNRRGTEARRFCFTGLAQNNIKLPRNYISSFFIPLTVDNLYL